MPGNAEAKITPVSSRMPSGSIQRSGRNLPVVVLRHVWTSGIPASRNASMPAAIASCVVVSSASISLSGTPYSADRSKGPGRPASLMTSAVSSIVWKLPLPSSLFTTRVTRLFAICCRKRSGNRSMNCSPRRMRSALAGSMTGFSAPGRPSPVPEITTDPVGASLRSNARAPGWPMDWSIEANIWVTVSTDGASAPGGTDVDTGTPWADDAATGAAPGDAGRAAGGAAATGALVNEGWRTTTGVSRCVGTP